MSIAKDFLQIPIFLSLIIVLVAADNEIGISVCAAAIILYFVLKFIKKYCVLKRKLVKQREYFIRVLSHDLRVSTLAQLRGLELLEKLLPKAEQKELLSDIDESCRYTLDMISMLLNTFRFENGEQILNYEKINIESLLLSCITQIEKFSNEKSVEILCIKKSPADYLEADRAYITKVLVTLLITAVSNSERGKQILITVFKDGENIGFSLGYQGKSLTEEEYRRMFSDNSNFSTVGHGIRMNFCKKIIEFHKGEIKVLNNGDKINSFTFKIPVKRSESISQEGCSGIIQSSVY